MPHYGGYCALGYGDINPPYSTTNRPAAQLFCHKSALLDGDNSVLDGDEVGISLTRLRGLDFDIAKIGG